MFTISNTQHSKGDLFEVEQLVEDLHIDIDAADLSEASGPISR
jgi:hypothetical protein